MLPARYSSVPVRYYQFFLAAAEFTFFVDGLAAKAAFLTFTSPVMVKVTVGWVALEVMVMGFVKLPIATAL